MIQIEDKISIKFNLIVCLRNETALECECRGKAGWAGNGYINFYVKEVYYQYLIICDEVMYWAYIFTPGLYYQTVFPAGSGTATTIPEEACESLQNLQIHHETIQVSSLILNLSAEDLMKAGYQNCKTPWTEQEDEKLKNLRDIQQLDWAELAKLMPGRNSKMCYSRYRRLENNTKESWKKKDDLLLGQLVKNHAQDWKEISKYFPKRTLKQVKEHYLNYLRPEIKKDQWTLEEDLKLVEQINLHGKNWKIIENNFQGRTQNQIKNRYFGRLKRLAQKKVVSKDKSLPESKNGREE